MSEPSPTWFYAKGADKFGPFPHSHLVELARSGGLDPRLDLVWGPGLADWQPAGEIEGLFEKRAPEPSSANPTPGSPTAKTGTGGVWDEIPDYGDTPPPRAKYPGSGRFAYFFGLTIAVPLLAAGGAYLLPKLGAWIGDPFSAYLPFVLIGILILLSLAIVLGRFANLGMSRWWILGQLVPFLNLWLGYRLFACPPGYATAKKMDGIGIALAILYWLAFAASIALIVAALLTGALEMKDSGKWDELLRQLEEIRQSAPAK